MHGDFQENVTSRGATPTDLDNLHEIVPRPEWNKPSAAPWGDKEGVEGTQFALTVSQRR